MHQKKKGETTKPCKMDVSLEGPYKLTYRWKPKEKAQCYMLGTLNGFPHKFVTGVTVEQSNDFTKIMQKLLEEAHAGHFATKAECVQRRNMLLGRRPKVGKPPAEPADAEVGLDVD